MREWLAGMSTSDVALEAQGPALDPDPAHRRPRLVQRLVVVGGRGHRDDGDLLLVQDDRAAFAVGQEGNEGRGVVHPLLRPHGPGVRLRGRREEDPAPQDPPVGAEHLRRPQEPGDLEARARPSLRTPVRRPSSSRPPWRIIRPRAAPRNAARPADLPGQAPKEHDLARAGPAARDQAAQLREDVVRARGVEVADLQQGAPQLAHRLLHVAGRGPAPPRPRRTAPGASRAASRISYARSSTACARLSDGWAGSVGTCTSAWHRSISARVSPEDSGPKTRLSVRRRPGRRPPPPAGGATRPRAPRARSCPRPRRSPPRPRAGSPPRRAPSRTSQAP